MGAWGPSVADGKCLPFWLLRLDQKKLEKASPVETFLGGGFKYEPGAHCACRCAVVALSLFCLLMCNPM